MILRRLSSKFILFVGVILIAVYIVESAFITTLERRFLSDQLSERGQLLGSFVALVSADAVVGYDMVSLNHFVDELGRQPGVLVGAVLDQWGRSMAVYVAPNRFATSPPEERERFGEWMDRTLGAEPSLTLQTFSIAHMDHELGRVVMVLDSDYGEPLVERVLNRRLMLHGGAIVVLSLLLFLGFRRMVLRPLDELGAGTARVAEGLFEHHVPRHSDDELGRLSDAVNAMMDGLHDRTEELRMITRAVEQSSASVVITDTGGEIVYVNPQFTQVTGYSFEEAIGENPRLLKSGETSEAEYFAMWRTISGGGVWRGEFHNRTKDGTLFWESATIAPMRDDHEVITHYIAVKEEITWRKAMERELQEQRDRAEASSIAKSEFLAAMSHEIRTPMNVVIGMSDLLLERVTDPEQEEYLHRLQHAGNSLLELINNILDLSKIEAGKLTVGFAPLPFKALLEEIVEVFALSFEAKGIALNLVLEEGVPEVILGDGGRLRQILINLISNALKFTEQGGVRVAVAVEAVRGGGERLHLRVIDSGIGIGPEHLDKIFEKFIQVDSGVGRRYGGTGLGLSISRQLVELMEGRIWVESVDGEGSTFHFTLPLVEGRLEDPVEGDEVELPLAGGGAKRILLVEDSEDNRQLIKAFLKSSDHQLEMVTDGEQGFERVCESAREGDPFDLVLMDMQMPVMDGYAATRAIRRWERVAGCEPVRIIALTAHALEGDRERSLEVGCDDHLTKPIKKRRLLEAVG